MGKFPFKSGRDGLIDVACSGHAHGLIDVATSAQRIADSSSETGGCPAERLDLSRVVVRLVFELQEPFLDGAVNVHVYVDAAGIVLFALLKVFEQPFFLEIACSDRSEVYEAERLVFAAKFLADLMPLTEALLQVGRGEGIVDFDVGQFGRESGVAAVVAPVGVENAELSLVGVAAFGREIFHHLHQVVAVHCEPLLLAESQGAFCRYFAESFKHGHGFGGGAFRGSEDGKVFPARFHGIDAIMGDLLHLLFAYGGIEDHQFSASDPDVGVRLD